MAPSNPAAGPAIIVTAIGLKCLGFMTAMVLQLTAGGLKKSRFGLLIFDCDGVLDDSEMITHRVFVRMLNDLGIPVTIGNC